MSQQAANVAQSPAQEAPQRDSEQVRFLDLQTLASFCDEGPSIQVVSEHRVARLMLLSFKAGQQLREHHTTNQLTVQVIRGHVVFTAEGKSFQLEAGAVLQLEPNVPHSVIASTEAVLLLTKIIV